jgi:hypothetical protein
MAPNNKASNASAPTQFIQTKDQKYAAEAVSALRPREDA